MGKWNGGDVSGTRGNAGRFPFFLGAGVGERWVGIARAARMQRRREGLAAATARMEVEVNCFFFRIKFMMQRKRFWVLGRVEREEEV
jgi:hypothetical protein